MTLEREWLKEGITQLAQAKGVKGGKWMLFPSVDQVDNIWAQVARATLGGTLGCAAKVATNNGTEDARLVCIYTEDFSDTQDVMSVLTRMAELQLTRTYQKGQSIYYKCDAYTHLDIMNGNEYNLRASMYSSKEMFQELATKR